MNSQTKNQNGFTLVEILLYLAIVTVLVSALGVFINYANRLEGRREVIAEVEEQGIAATQVLTQMIRNSSSLTAPAAGANASSLTIATSEVGANPTVFSLSGGVLQATRGANPALALTNSKVVVSGLTFKNLTKGSTPGTVKFQFTVAFDNPGATPQFTYQKIFYGSASLR